MQTLPSMEEVAMYIWFEGILGTAFCCWVFAFGFGAGELEGELSLLEGASVASLEDGVSERKPEGEVAKEEVEMAETIVVCA